MIAFKSKILSNFNEKEGYHQAILDAGYTKWQENPEWPYSQMIDYVHDTFGLEAAFAILIGKYNQQVCNGGHIQYYDNGYADGNGGCFSSHDTDCPLHHKMLQWYIQLKIEDYLNLANANIGTELKKILELFEIEVDDQATVEEDVWDDDEERYITEDVHNDTYGCVTNTWLLDDLDDRYYAIYEEVMPLLEEYFKNLLIK